MRLKYQQIENVDMEIEILKKKLHRNYGVEKYNT